MEEFGTALVDALVKQGVTYFCLAPGFRSTPLAVAAAKRSDIETFVHFDERGLAFHALGYAKASGKPVALIVTSGTAVGNLMPAVMEADASGVPLLLLTADRPHDLRDTMANQTCDQIKFFGGYVRYFVDLPLPDPSLPEQFLPSTCSHAVFRAQYPHPGPVHINCPFREPLFSQQIAPPQKAIVHTRPVLSLENPEVWADELSQIKRGVIVLGRGAPDPTTLSEKLGWPILPDILSGYREKASNRTIAHYHHVLQALPDLQADCVLHLGDALVSKKLLQWMAKAPRYIHVAAHHKRCDPCHVVTDRIVCDLTCFCEQVAPLVPMQDQEWFLEWEQLGKRAQEVISLPEGSEPAALYHLADDTALFFGNSMPIRDADMFFFPKAPCGPIFANRGLSGIDGNIATIAGIAQHHPVTAIIGDQTALHDLNSLALLKKTKHRARIIILNNGGGGIFSFVAKEAKGLLDPYFAAAHDLTFAHAAAQFGLSYANHWREGADITELFSNREENFALHQQISDQVCSSFSMVF